MIVRLLNHYHTHSLHLNAFISGVLRILALARLNRCFYIYKVVSEQSITIKLSLFRSNCQS